MKNVYRRHSRLVIALFLALSLLTALKIESSLAQLNRQDQAKPVAWQERQVSPRRLTSNFRRVDTSAFTERIIENQVPQHVPIRVEIRNLNVEPMFHNLEVKVTNIADKPMYVVQLDLLTPEIVVENGTPIWFHLVFGRPELRRYQESVRDDDAPLMPQESCVLEIPKSNLEAFDQRSASMGLTFADLKLFYLTFAHLKFKDNTGFAEKFGAPYPRVTKSAKL
jgi:hypothetical protein